MDRLQKQKAMRHPDAITKTTNGVVVRMDMPGPGDIRRPADVEITSYQSFLDWAWAGMPAAGRMIVSPGRRRDCGWDVFGRFFHFSRRSC